MPLNKTLACTQLRRPPMPASPSDANSVYSISEDGPEWDPVFIDHVVKSNVFATMLSPTDFGRPFCLRILLPAYRLSCM